MSNKQNEFEKCKFPGYEKAKKYIINLDEEPRKRWKEVVKDHITPLKKFIKEIKKVQETELGTSSLSGVISTVFYYLQKSQPYLIEEIEGIAKETKEFGLDFNNLLILNLGYSVLARCTSGCIESKDNDNIFHFRNMDWDMEVLRELTFDADFRKNDKTVFLATQWVGYVGVLTGMRVKDDQGNGWTLSLNFRNCCGSLLSNLSSMLFGSDSIEFLIRDTLQNEPTFEAAVKILSSTSIVSPCYLVITGTKNGQGVLLTRERINDLKRINLKDGSFDPTRFITQTNIDHWEEKFDKDWAGTDDLLWNALDRRKKSIEILKKIDYKDEKQMIDDLYDHLFSFPVLNYQTIYSNIICVNQGIYETRVIKPSQYHLDNDPYYKK